MAFLSHTILCYNSSNLKLAVKEERAVDFRNRLKSKVTQGLLESLLEDVNYRIVPLGIEEVVRELKSLEMDKYVDLGLPKVFRSLPDFFVARPDFAETWLIEVKYRKQWNDKIRDEMKATLANQVQAWQPLHLVLFLGEPAKAYNTPAFHLGVARLVLVEGVLGIEKYADGTSFVKWDEARWDDFARFQDVFDSVRGKWKDETLVKAISLVKNMNEVLQ